MKTAILIHPGEILADELKARNWTQKQFAELVQKSPQEVSFIITGKRNLNADWALRLESAMGISAQSWLNMQNAYDLQLENQEKANLFSLIKFSAQKHQAELALI